MSLAYGTNIGAIYGSDAQMQQLDSMFADITGRSMTSQEMLMYGPMIQTSSWDQIRAAMQDQYLGSNALKVSLGSIGGAIGTVFGGPVGGVIGAGIGNALQPKAPAPTTTGILSGGTIGSVVGGMIPGVGGGAGGLIGGLISGLTSGGSKPNGKQPYSVKAPLTSNQCPPGYHLVVKKGMGLDMLARDVCVKKKRMNVFNRRALGRANTRVMGFARAATPALKSLGFTVSKTRHPHGMKVKGVSTSSRSKKGCGCR